VGCAGCPPGQSGRGCASYGPRTGRTTGRGLRDSFWCWSRAGAGSGAGLSAGRSPYGHLSLPGSTGSHDRQGQPGRIAGGGAGAGRGKTGRRRRLAAARPLLGIAKRGRQRRRRRCPSASHVPHGVPWDQVGFHALDVGRVVGPVRVSTVVSAGRRAHRGGGGHAHPTAASEVWVGRPGGFDQRREVLRRMAARPAGGNTRQWLVAPGWRAASPLDRLAERLADDRADLPRPGCGSC
jgi:hypothetical protein